MGLFDRKKRFEIELGPKLFKALVDVMLDPSGLTQHENIAFGGRESKQSLWIVGELNYQENISIFKTGWAYGFLIPEQDNKYDSNAVALYFISDDYEIFKVGYLKKEVAAKVSQHIANLLAFEGKVIPVLGKVEGGSAYKPNFGVSAWARTKAVNFGK